MKLICKDCPKTFKSQLALKYHVRKHAKPHICSICKCRFVSKDEVESHKIKHEKNVKLENDNSVNLGVVDKKPHESQKKIDKSQLINQIEELLLQRYGNRSSDAVKSDTGCLIGDKIKNNCNLLKDEGNKSKFKQETVGNPTLHEQPHANKNTKTEMTDHIEQTTDTDGDFKVLFHPNSAKDRCPISNKINNSEDPLTKHFCKLEKSKAKRNDDSAIFCNVCKKVYKNKTSFTHHSCKPEEVIIKKKTCEICEKSFKTKEHLRQHQRSHTGEKPFLCISCGKAFTQQGNLIKHMRIHAGTKMFLCEVCSRPFMTKGALTEHSLIHSDEKQYQCEVCKKTFRHKHGYENHLHKRKYPCNVRKYGENKWPKKKKKVKNANVETANMGEAELKCKFSEISSGSIITYTSDHTGSKEYPVAGTNSNLHTQDTAHIEHKPVASEHTASFQSNSEFRSLLLSNDTHVFGLEHGIQRVQSFTDMLNLPPDENQVNRYNDLAMSDTKIGISVTDKTVYYSDPRITNITRRSFEGSESVENRSEIYNVKMIIQNNDEAVSPMYEVNHLNDPEPVLYCQPLNTQQVHASHICIEDGSRDLIVERCNNECTEKRNTLQNQCIVDPLSSKQQTGKTMVKVYPGKCQKNQPNYSPVVLTSPNENVNVELEDAQMKENVKKSLDRNQTLSEGDGSDDTIRFVSLSELNTKDIEHDETKEGYVGPHSMSVHSTVTTFSKIISEVSDTESSIESHGMPERNVEIGLKAKADSCKTSKEMSEEEILKIIEKAQSKNFRCGNCNRNFANEYCLSVHVCKCNGTADRRKTKERKNCKVCGRNYSNKYLLATHSCRPFKRLEKRLSKAKNWQKKNINSEIDNCVRLMNANENINKTRNCMRVVSAKEEKKKSLIEKRTKTIQTEQVKNKDKNPEVILEASEKNIKTELGVHNAPDNDTTKDTGNLVCEVCKKSYKNKTNLKKHSCKPTAEESKTCQVCGKLFKLRSHLQDHMRIHTGEQPFLCKVCGKLFNQESNLMKHMRIHNPQKLFKCEICDREFTQKGALTEHRKVHLSIKPFVCKKCNKGFRHKHGLQHHMMKKFPCDAKRNKKVTVKKKKSKKKTVNKDVEQKVETEAETFVQCDASETVRAVNSQIVPCDIPGIVRAVNSQNVSIAADAIVPKEQLEQENITERITLLSQEPQERYITLPVYAVHSDWIAETCNMSYQNL